MTKAQGHGPNTGGNKSSDFGQSSIENLGATRGCTNKIGEVVLTTFTLQMFLQ